MKALQTIQHKAAKASTAGRLRDNTRRISEQCPKSEKSTVSSGTVAQREEGDGLDALDFFHLE
jgi:hypothetical protein